MKRDALPDLAARLHGRAAHSRAFVRQLDAPTLHRAFGECADLMDEAATEIVALRTALGIVQRGGRGG